MVEAIAGLPDRLRTGPEYGSSRDQPPLIRPYVDLRVANTDWPFSDHGSYWDNDAEVMARIIHAIACDDFGLPNTDWTNGHIHTETPLGKAINDTINGETKPERPDVIAQHFAGARGRRRRVTLMRLATLTASAIAIGLLVFRRDLFTAIREQFPAEAGTALKGKIASLIGVTPSDAVLAWLADAAIWAIVVMAVVLLFRLVFHLRAWSRPLPPGFVAWKKRRGA